MAGLRIKNVTGNQDSFSSELVLLVDRVDTGTNDWLQARKLPLALLGNVYFQGSNNNVDWHDEILATDTFIQFSTDGGDTWIPLNTDIVREGSNNLYFTEARVLATPGIQDAVDDTHTHTNKTLLDNIIDSGSGNSLLSDDGTYKSESLIGNVKAISTKTSNYTVTTSDYTILLDGSSNTVTSTLPSAVSITGRIFNVKCIDDTYTCDVATNGVEEIDGDSSNFQLFKDESITVQSTGIGWIII